MEVEGCGKIHPFLKLFYLIRKLYLFHLLTDIWLIGDSLVSHLEEDSAAVQGSCDLPHRIRWLGQGGMHWTQLKASFQRAMLFCNDPTSIIIHLGGNDLVTVTQSRMIKRMKKDLRYISSVYPSARLIWSDILPRTSWRGVVNTPEKLKTLDNKRKRINRAGRQITRTLPHGYSIIHELDSSTSGLFKTDGVHLTLIGNAIFLNTFEEALVAFSSHPDNRVYNANN